MQPSRSVNRTTLANTTLRESGEMQREREREREKAIAIAAVRKKSQFCRQFLGGNSPAASDGRRCVRRFSLGGERKRGEGRGRGRGRGGGDARRPPFRAHYSPARNVPLLAAEERGRVSVTRARQMGVARVEERGKRERGGERSLRGEEAGNPGERGGGERRRAHFFRLSGIWRHN